MSVILKVAFVGAAIAGLDGLSPYAGTIAVVVISVKTQFLDQFKIRFISQLANGMFKLFQKPSKCFNDITILTFSILLLSLSSLLRVFSIIVLLYLNDEEFVIGFAF